MSGSPTINKDRIKTFEGESLKELEEQYNKWVDDNPNIEVLESVYVPYAEVVEISEKYSNKVEKKIIYYNNVVHYMEVDEAHLKRVGAIRGGHAGTGVI